VQQHSLSRAAGEGGEGGEELRHCPSAELQVAIRQLTSWVRSGLTELTH
jgi:hypothetical protein